MLPKLMQLMNTTSRYISVKPLMGMLKKKLFRSLPTHEERHRQVTLRMVRPRMMIQPKVMEYRNAFSNSTSRNGVYTS